MYTLGKKITQPLSDFYGDDFRSDYQIVDKLLNKTVYGIRIGTPKDTYSRAQSQVMVVLLYQMKI